MSTKIIATETGGGQRKLPPSGTHAARCFSVVHTGTQKPDKEGFAPKNVVRISWELPEEKAVFKEGEEERSFAISKQYNLSLNEKATLRKDLEGWRGKPFTADELKAFDVTKLIGVPCMVSVIHKASDNGKTYANVTSVSTVPKSMTVPELSNGKVTFSVNDFDQKVFDTFPEWLQDEVKDSAEFKAMSKPKVEDKSEKEDDLPF